MKSLNKDPNIRALAFLLATIIVIALTIITLTKAVELQSTGRGQIERQKYKVTYSFNNIKNLNYHFLFTKVENGKTTIYEGDRYDDMFEYVVLKDGEEDKYFQDGYQVLKRNKQNAKWEDVEDPIDFKEFFNVTIMKKIIGGSNCYSRTEYADNDDVLYNYQTSSSTIAAFAFSDLVDIDDLPNKINATINGDNELYKIKYEVSNFYKFLKNDQNYTFNLTLKFSKFGKIKELEKPEIG